MEEMKSTAWMTRFGKKMQQLQPAMDVGRVAKLALDAHRRNFDLRPENAAERLVHGSEAGESGTSEPADRAD